MKKLLTCAQEKVYADKAYASAEQNQLPVKRSQPLSDRQKQQNRQWSSVRSTVERVFGALKRYNEIAKARYLSTKPGSCWRRWLTTSTTA